MTIGVQMPLKTMLDAIVRDKGRDDMPDQKPAKDKDVLSDFSSMVRAIGPKLKLDKENAKPDKRLAELRDRAELDEHKDVRDAPAQGIFGQAILAFEQLLDRQQHENSEQPQPVTKANASTKADIITAEPIQSVEAGQKSEKPAEISAPDNKSGKTDLNAVTDRQVAAPLQDKQEPGRQVPHAGQDVAPATQAPEAPKPKVSSKAAPVEYAAPVETAPSAPSPSVQLEAKLTAAASNNAMPVQTSRRPITDVQVLSDRSTPGARTLVVQLQPIELGTVTARMRLTPEGMHIQLMAENPAMAEHLAKDHDMLGKALQRAGAADDAASVTISVIDRSGTSSSAQTGQHNPSAQDQQPGARGSGQGQSGFQGTPGDRSGNQWPFAEMRSDERVEKATHPDIERRLSRGLVV
ncbi:flagellar hook-length control protein FliK [Phyllobacterium zundukense]|uniref:Flagellar hook-length control protein FliK n=1 Tax=Phyllobacterium zundukense TaxID=1867719 RepID=A0ACD4CZE4_9HYPH|nr:flagellar hook-length control protein FliK [Phyllobacterium zundukense]UXN58918.1 flagellar hook-length control protein FliK [Phyllobacterium zundukense]